jgi:1-acyl-sn-glycerol-3-phosphate acyltransferase
MKLVRSALYNVVFYLNLSVFLIGGFGLFFAPRRWAVEALQTWARSSLWLLKRIVGTRLELRGLEHLPQGPAIVAGKHQSAWDIFGLLPMLREPAVVMKRELMFIPLFGWFSLKFEMIGIDRRAGAGALRKMVSQARQAVKDGRQILIFPEGTRRAPGAPPDYKPGVAAIYLGTGVTCIPFALNSGLYWPRRRFLRRPGTIIVEFLPPIPPGLSRREFENRLIAAIEPATERLLAEARGEKAMNEPPADQACQPARRSAPTSSS